MYQLPNAQQRRDILERSENERIARQNVADRLAEQERAAAANKREARINRICEEAHPAITHAITYGMPDCFLKLTEGSEWDDAELSIAKAVCERLAQPGYTFEPEIQDTSYTQQCLDRDQCPSGETYFVLRFHRAVRVSWETIVIKPPHAR